MNVTFENTVSSITTDIRDPNLISRLNGSLISFPRIIDGMGEKAVMCDCNNCKHTGFTRFAEMIIFEWNIDDTKYEKGFFGNDSYLIQNIIHKLESQV